MSINGYPVDIYIARMDGYFGYFVWYSVPPISSGQEVGLNLVSIDSLHMVVSRESPDPETFYASIACRGTGWNFECGVARVTT